MWDWIGFLLLWRHAPWNLPMHIVLQDPIILLQSIERMYNVELFNLYSKKHKSVLSSHTSTLWGVILRFDWSSTQLVLFRPFHTNSFLVYFSWHRWRGYWRDSSINCPRRYSCCFDLFSHQLLSCILLVASLKGGVGEILALIVLDDREDDYVLR